MKEFIYSLLHLSTTIIIGVWDALDSDTQLEKKKKLASLLELF